MSNVLHQLPILIPEVKHLRMKSGYCRITTGVTIAASGMDFVLEQQLLHDALTSAGKLDEDTVNDVTCKYILFQVQNDDPGSERYSIAVSEEAITIEAPSPRGVFYGVQTLIQLLRHYGGTLPCLDINDEPDFPVRGYYHDVTRGKIPTPDTLKYLVDKLAFYKINQLQLYVEHAFSFSAVPEFSEAFDTLTKEDVAELGRYCHDRYIDLVPSLATFGHLYELLRIPRLAHLNELYIDASHNERNLWDRMAHYTIDPSNNESFELVRLMISEYCSLFSSRLVNICCDETFDLGKGKNAEAAKGKGVGRLYVDFVKKILSVVVSLGKQPMMWGDIALDHPEILSELPPDTIFLNWNYKPDCLPDATRKLSEAGVKQYVCPGVIGWSRFANDINAASKNIRRKIAFGKDFGASGVLNTDWGDCGHVNFLTSSLHGMALGAALSWNSATFPDDTAFDKAVAVVEWGNELSWLYGDLREIGSLCDYHFGNIYAWITGTPCLWNREAEIKGWKYDDIRSRFYQADALHAKLVTCPDMTSDTFEAQEILCGVREIRWTLALLCAKMVHEYDVAGDLPMSIESLHKETEMISGLHSRLWLVRNKKSELDNITAVFAQVNKRIWQWQ